MKQLAPAHRLNLSLGALFLALGLAGVSLPASAQVTPYGSGINPANSLALTAGVPQTGASFQLSVRNTAAANPLLGFAYLYLANQPAPGFPAGLVLPGLGLGSPGSNGELLLDALPPNPFLTLGPTLYLGGTSTGANFSLSVPSNPSLAGVDVFAQGLLVTDNQGFLLGLTNALQITLGAPSGPIPGVTPIPGLAIIQPGTFQMGSSEPFEAPYYGEDSEKPVHSVTISKPFWMGTTEVTQAQYQALMGVNPSWFQGANNPVEQVSWFNAQAYCAALTVQQSVLGNVPAGYQYRLPTEAEWEYACRAGTTTEFNLGSALSCNQARFIHSYHSGLNCGSTSTLPVSSYLPNNWGLYDMHGNVREWCLDSYASYSAGQSRIRSLHSAPTGSSAAAAGFRLQPLPLRVPALLNPRLHRLPHRVPGGPGPSSRPLKKNPAQRGWRRRHGGDPERSRRCRSRWPHGAEALRGRFRRLVQFPAPSIWMESDEEATEQLKRIGCCGRRFGLK